MDGNFKTKVMCCFCGEYFEIREALVLMVFPSIENEESTGLYSHRKCFLQKVHKSVIIHPDIMEERDLSHTEKVD